MYILHRDICYTMYIPVSYTHLDVYKRQLLASGKIPSSILQEAAQAL
ncbi:hypothetical protein A5876_000191, partial [Enterococcus sp. 3C8_DIV0646]